MNDEQQTPTHSNPEFWMAYNALIDTNRQLEADNKRLQNIIAMFRTEERNRRVADSRAAESKDNRHLKSVEVSQDSRAYQSKGDSDE